MLAVSAWHLRRGSSVEAFASTARMSLVVLVPAIMLAMFVGSELGVVEAKYQPMKIAAAEAQWNTCQPCSFSLFQIGGGKDDETPTQILEIPHLLSLLATNHWNGEVAGPQPGQRPVPAAVRARQLRAQRVHPVLVDAGHGLPRRPGPAAGPVGGVGGVATDGWSGPAGSCCVATWSHRPLPDEHRRLVPDRKRPPALDRPGAA